MTISDRTLQKLDYDKITGRLAGRCILNKARQMAEQLVPYTIEDDIRLALEETEEGRNLVRVNPMFSVRGAKDIGPLLERCAIGGVLAPEELLQVRDTLRAGRYIRREIAESLNFPRLKEIVLPIEPQKSLEDEITRCITEDATVSDQASQELANLRKSMLRLQQRIRDSLDSFLRKSSFQKMLQDPIITQRSERYVIPVKQEYRSAFPGIVHDQSSSGATLFIEPLPVVQLGNELREVILREQREVLRILQELSGGIGSRLGPITNLYEAVARMDFVLAKAHMALDMNAGAPVLLGRAEIRLIQARHPLLSGHVVPLTVELGISFDTLVITGPNTGGKTVALKTLGLLVAMAQSGLHIPAEDGSRMGVFTRLFVDIGDEQSVEQSLSTFSGHMKNIVQVVAEADSRSLILLDEVGAGTDPTEGAALAMAILGELHERGCRVVATTHYGALKSFAYKTPRVENASVDFDVVTLQPTYRLLIGIPGKSNAFNIAARLGLKGKVLEKAKTFLSEREMQVADLLENLEDARREIEREKRRVEEELQSAQEQKLSWEQKKLSLAEEHQAMLARTRDEATEVLRSAKREAEQLIQELKDALKQEQKDSQAMHKARQGLKNLSEKLDKQAEQNVLHAGGLKAGQIKLGQMVYMTKLRQKGQVLALPNESGEVLVQAGIIKVNVPLGELQLVQEEAPKKTRVSGAGKLGMDKAESVRHEIDIRGKLVEEAAYLLDKYLDDAILSGIGQIYVIHGKGTGALRAGVQDFLRGHPHVRSFRLGQHGEGDSGVTVVELK